MINGLPPTIHLTNTINLGIFAFNTNAKVVAKITNDSHK
jgi:hypothetical protein